MMGGWPPCGIYRSLGCGCQTAEWPPGGFGWENAGATVLSFELDLRLEGGTTAITGRREVITRPSCADEVIMKISGKGRRARLSRGAILNVLASCAVLLALSMSAEAQSYPSRYVRLVVPFPPGGGGDALARPLAHRLSEVWGQQVVIENKGGAGGNFGAQMVAQAEPDGYTLLLGAAFLAINPFIYPSSGYSATNDLAPITLITVIPNLMMVPNTSPAKSVAEFIQYAKTNPGKVTFASTGIGASPHLSGELFKQKASIEMTHVPYRGAGPAMNDLIPGRVDAMFSNLPGVISQAQNGTIRGLAVTSAKRSPAAPHVPTIGETVPGYEVTSWWGLYAPAKTPAEIMMRIHADTIAALGDPLVSQRYQDIGAPVTTSTGKDLAALLKAETQKWGPIVKGAGIKLD
jgi:tripartite-type tricarboxylate transporter receptor subunit TctC